eukprot:365557-Chlamydomonas_euryale.AAC.12
MEELQRRMEVVVLGLQSGSYAQRVQVGVSPHLQAHLGAGRPPGMSASASPDGLRQVTRLLRTLQANYFAPGQPAGFRPARRLVCALQAGSGGAVPIAVGGNKGAGCAEQRGWSMQRAYR